MLDPVDNPLNYKFGTFYYNEKDSRFIVPKRARALGWSVNFAHRGSHVFLGALVIVMIASLFFPGITKI